MRRFSQSVMKLDAYKLPAVALFGVLLLAACSTQNADQPVMAGNMSASEISALDNSTLLVLDGSGSAGLALVTNLDVSNVPMRIRVDGHYVVNSMTPPIDYDQVMSQGGFGTLPSSTAYAPDTHRLPGGFPSGTHTITLEREDGSTVASTTQDFAANAFNTVIVYGSFAAATVSYFSDAVPEDPSLRVVRIMNLTTSKEALTVTSCLGAAPCTPQDSSLAYGDSWVATLTATDAAPAVVFPQEGITFTLLEATTPQDPQDFFYAFRSPSGW